LINAIFGIVVFVDITEDLNAEEAGARASVTFITI
jgi:hypothetical protein